MHNLQDRKKIVLLAILVVINLLVAAIQIIRVSNNWKYKVFRNFDYLYHGYMAQPVFFGLDNETVLMAVQGPQIVFKKSTDKGKTWQVYSKIYIPGTDFLHGGNLTRLDDKTLLTRVSCGNKTHQIFISSDNAKTWLFYKDLGVMKGYYSSPGPLRILSDGRYYLFFYGYSRELKRETGFILISKDKGDSWSKPIPIPRPIDKNEMINECDILEIDRSNYLLAIRSDSGDSKSWDGFYISRSRDGYNWSTPTYFSGAEIGRMPLFYRFNDFIVLSYRSIALVQPEKNLRICSALSFSKNGSDWETYKFIGEETANSNPYITKLGEKYYFFNTAHDFPLVVRVNITSLINKFSRINDVSGQTSLLDYREEVSSKMQIHWKDDSKIKEKVQIPTHEN